MTLATATWRRFPVRGPGRAVIAQLRRRAAQGTLVADGPFGTRLTVDPDNGAELSVCLWGTYAPEVEAAVGRLLRPGSTVIDIGSDGGVMAAMMGVLCRPGRVLAVERTDSAGVRIGRQAQLNGCRVELVVGDPTRLDELLGDRLDGPVALIRILAGGTEAEVLRGARTLLGEAHPALIFDWCPETWGEIGETPAATAALLESLGYELFAPVMRRAPAWSVAPWVFERFVPASLATLGAGTLAGSQVVALAAGPGAEASRRRLLAAA